MITQERLKEVLSYNNVTGYFIWLVDKGKVTAGTRAGHAATTTPYRYIKIDQIAYPEHRLAWLYVYGVFPEVVDHINGNKTYNAICNLREATATSNNYNSTLRCDNTTGVKGVQWRPSRQTYSGIVRANKLKHRKEIGVTRTRTKEQALSMITEWVRAKRIELHGEFANHG